MSSRGITFVFMLLFPLSAWSKPPVAWQRLLHYKVSGGDFFLTPHGAAHPEQELQANLEALQQNQSVKMSGVKTPYVCAFPARTQVLQREFHLKPTTTLCPELEAFLSQLNAEALSLVYSSSYPNSPASMFGHTFLRIHSRTKGTPQSALLDYGLNYSALTSTDDNAMVYAMKGLYGGYPGSFDIAPFYTKVNEYNYSESRDLWEYKLALTPQEVRLILLHVWELKHHAQVNYYFADENCSYRLLTLLEVAKPEWDLSRFTLHAIPGETIKRVTQTSGAVTALTFRPSLRHQLYKRLDKLNSDQKDTVFKVANQTLSPTQLKDIPSTNATLTLLRYRSSGSPKTQLYREILLHRSQLPEAGYSNQDPSLAEGSERATVLPGSSVEHTHLRLSPNDEQTRPDLGHGAYQLGWSGGALKAGGFTELTFKLAYHDLMNQEIGYSKYSGVDFPGVSVRYGGHVRSFTLEKLNLLSVTSLFPMRRIESSWSSNLSWKFESFYSVNHNYGCDDCHTLTLEPGVGGTVSLFKNDSSILYTLALGHFEAGTLPGNSLSIGPGVQTGVILSPLPSYKTHLQGKFLLDLESSNRPNLIYLLRWEHRLGLAQNWEVRWNFDATWISKMSPLSSSQIPYREFKLGFFYYW